VIATPAATHAKLALRAIEAGKDVLIEKPMATSVDEANQLIEAAEETGSIVMVGHTFEYNAAVRYLRSLIDDGSLGKLYYLG
jgi:predicted dehydrogenase